MADDRSKGTLLVLSQVYVPDPASVGQHMADAVHAMARRGYRALVYTANRGYEDPSIRYVARETRDQVEIRRLPLTSFGKSSILLRLIGGISFVVQCIVRGLFTAKIDGILITTSPPMCALAALLIALVRRVPIHYWLMDLNPDQMVALGKVRAGSPAVRLFHVLNGWIFTQAAGIIVLDRYMLQRVGGTARLQRKIKVLPPWPLEDHLESVPHDANPFRQEHPWSGKRVIMFSGNLSIASPVTTILDAALKLQHEERLVFVFIGGGLGKRQVDDLIRRHKPRNLVSLPYQPLQRIKYSLSAADVHLVSLGENMAGIIHPCKIYGAMAVARPILFLGPTPSHIADIIAKNGIGWQVRHGDVQGAMETLQTIVREKPEELTKMGIRARAVIDAEFQKKTLITEFCDFLEDGMRRSKTSLVHL